jgi:hypothetical protein
MKFTNISDNIEMQIIFRDDSRKVKDVRNELLHAQVIWTLCEVCKQIEDNYPQLAYNIDIAIRDMYDI